MTPQRNILALIPALAAAVLLLTPALARADDDKKPKTSYMLIPGLGASVVRSYGGHGVMTVEAGLDVQDKALRNYADQMLPVLQDAYAQALQGYAGGLRPGALPDADYIALRLQAATDRVLGRRGAKLLLGGIMVN